MKPEPLKGKATIVLEDEVIASLKKMGYGNVIFPKEDIKSAVEWLKERVEEGIEHNGTWYDLDPEETLEAINKAFEDVIKK